MIIPHICSKNDEWYTPRYVVIPLLKYIKPYSNIWCPFDKETSMFVKVFKENCFNVTYTHIDNNQDFFEIYKQIKYNDITKQSIDYIIYNPPYSNKTEILEKLFELDISFAMLVNIIGLFEAKRYNIFKNNKFEMMYFNKRVNYINPNNNENLNPPFSSAYVCHNILPQQIVFEELDKNIKER